MREIGVRIWDVGNMFYRCSIGSHNPAVRVDGEWKECTEKAIVMLDTGLFDKNGKEIWEGDLLQNEWDKKVHEVVFKRGCFTCNQNTNDRFEVIGNIYEDTELLD